MSEQTPENPETSTIPTEAPTHQAARTGIGLIALLFMLPLVLMLVTSIVCIAVVLAKR